MVASSPFTVKVDGLRELEKWLKKYAPELEKELLKEYRVIANEAVAEIRADVPKRTGNAARSVKTSVTTSTRGAGGVAIKAGAPNGSQSNKAPYFPWLDFGGVLRPTEARPPRMHGRHNTQVRPKIKSGRYIYPAIERLYPTLMARINEATTRVWGRIST